MSDMTNEDVIKMIRMVKPFPRAACLLLSDIRDGGSQTRAAAILGTDQVLAARVLSAANSSFYGMTGKIASIRDATIILGYDTLGAIAATAAYSSFSTGLSGDAESFRTHGMMAACIGDELASEFGLSRGDGLSLGLLHSIGSVLSLTEGHGFECSRCSEHAKYGAIMAREWGLPVFMGNALDSMASGMPEAPQSELMKMACSMAGFLLDDGADPSAAEITASRLALVERVRARFLEMSSWGL